MSGKSKTLLEFTLPAPAAADLGASWTIWGTDYYDQAAGATTRGVALLDGNGTPISPTISQKNWCLGAMEGTIAVTDAKGDTTTYNYEGRGPSRQTSCATYFPHYNSAKLASLERSRFRRARGPYGDGTGSYILSPYRSLAVDPKNIPFGTSLYIDKARGTKLTLPDGSTATHDGYFFAADAGGAIKGQHVDFFIGVSSKNPFAFVTSDSANTFQAREATNTQTCAYLRSLHTLSA